MAYQLESITMQADMSPESMAQVTEVWGDIASGRIPLLLNSDGAPAPGAAPVTEYIDYAGVMEGRPYTMTIRAVPPEFFAQMNQRAADGEFRLYETAGATIPECSAAAWGLAQEDETQGRVKIDYSYALESTVPPEYTKDGQAHCYLYVKPLS